MSVLTVTLNACVDKTYTVPGFALNRVHRPSATTVTPGGKGINVARVYRRLGGEASATGFLGGANGDWLERTIREDGITPDFVRVSEQSRVCIAIMDPQAGTQTELNENGPNVSAADSDALLERMRRLLPGRRALVLSGSMPPGTPVGLYREMVLLARESGVPCTLDSSGEPLALAAQAQPDFLKPNVHELGALGISTSDTAQAARELRSRFGVPLAMVTDGPRGAVLATSEGVFAATPPPIMLASAVGSGDTLTAAFLWALHSGYNQGEALRLGVAAGAANATTLGAGLFPIALISELAARTTLNVLT